MIDREGNAPVSITDATAERHLALSYAVTLNQATFGTDATAGSARVLVTASDLFDWLVGPAFIDIHVGQIVSQATGHPSGTQYTGGTMQLHDNEQCTLTVTEADAKGAALTDTLTWVIGSTAVATLQVAADTQSALLVAALPGSTVVTVTDGTLSATMAVDVVPGAVATVSIAASTPVVQPPPV